MNFNITHYNSKRDYHNLIRVIHEEGDEWKDYLHPQYQKNLEGSITYVAFVDDVLCGYIRSICDFGMFIWVIDLLVDKKYRGNGIGKALLEEVVKNHPDIDVLVMSDVDEYYQKLGFKKQGSIFNVG